MNTFIDNFKIKLKIDKLAKEKKWEELTTILIGLPFYLVLEIILGLYSKTQITIISFLPADITAKILSNLTIKQQRKLLETLDENKISSLLELQMPDDRIKLFDRMPKKLTEKLIFLLKPVDQKEARELLAHPTNSVGRLLTPRFIKVNERAAPSDVLREIRTSSKQVTNIEVIYVTQNNKLIGSIDLKKVLLARPNLSISNIMNHYPSMVQATEDREGAIKIMKDHDLSILPVVNKDKEIIGIVTFDDILDVLEQEATQDFHRIAAIKPLRYKYKDASIRELFFKRIGWLLVLVAVGLLSSGVIASYEETLAAAVALAFFIPLLIASGGNTGTQSATLMIRAISTGEIKITEWFRTIGKEMIVGFLIAIILGFTAGLLGIFRGGTEIGWIVGLSMASIVIVTNLIGGLLPFILLKFKTDPAVASGPLVTSVADAVGLLIYFSVATKILNLGS
jgi:magnesium transporter